jgi:hypothetical protein
MSLSIVVAVTASCAAYMTITGKRRPQKDVAGLSARQKSLEPQTPHLLNKVPSYAQSPHLWRSDSTGCAPDWHSRGQRRDDLRAGSA